MGTYPCIPAYLQTTTEYCAKYLPSLSPNQQYNDSDRVLAQATNEEHHKELMRKDVTRWTLNEYWTLKIDSIKSPNTPSRVRLLQGRVQVVSEEEDFVIDAPGSPTPMTPAQVIAGNELMDLVMESSEEQVPNTESIEEAPDTVAALIQESVEDVSAVATPVEATQEPTSNTVARSPMATPKSRKKEETFDLQLQRSYSGTNERARDR